MAQASETTTTMVLPASPNVTVPVSRTKESPLPIHDALPAHHPEGPPDVMEHNPPDSDLRGALKALVQQLQSPGHKDCAIQSTSSDFSDKPTRVRFALPPQPPPPSPQNGDSEWEDEGCSTGPARKVARKKPKLHNQARPARSIKRKTKKRSDRKPQSPPDPVDPASPDGFPAERRVDDFPGAPAQGDPALRLTGDPSEVVFPPFLLKDLAKHRAKEMGDQPRRKIGIDVEALVEEHGVHCGEFRAYTEREQSRRQALYSLAAARTQDLRDVQKKLAELDKARGMPGGRTSASSKELKDLERGYTLKATHLEETLNNIANELWGARAEAEGLIAGLLEWKPFETADLDSINPAVSQRAPQEIQSRGVGSANKAQTPEPINEPNQPRISQLGPTIEGPRPGLKEKFKLMYNKGLAALYEEQGANKNIEQRPTLNLPDWFAVMEATKCVPLLSEGTNNRYIELLNRIWRFETAMAVEEEDRKSGKKRKSWDKEWHEPNPGWSTPLQQKNGGWWKCRSGGEATAAEKSCRVCHRRGAPQQSAAPKREPNLPGLQQHGMPEGSAKQQYDFIMDEIQKCMAVVAERDKKQVFARLRCERADAETVLEEDNWKLRAGFLARDLQPSTTPPANTYARLGGPSHRDNFDILATGSSPKEDE